MNVRSCSLQRHFECVCWSSCEDPTYTQIFLTRHLLYSAETAAQEDGKRHEDDSDQFHLSRREEACGVTIYATFWFAAPIQRSP